MANAQAPMDEGRRQAYLAALGIPLWTSRYELPAALPSDALDFTPWLTEAEADAEESRVVEEASVVVAAPPPSKPAISPKVEPAIKASSPSPTREPVAAAPAANFPRFSCLVQWLAPEILVVMDLHNNPDLSAQEYRLLSNIAMAMGGDSALNPEREGLRWPMHESNPRFPRDIDSARETLAALIKKRGPAKRYIVLGETLGAYVRAGLPQQPVVVAASLAELLRQPMAKRQLWQALYG